MLFSFEDFKNPEILKIVNKINQFHVKEKFKKIKSLLVNLEDFLIDETSEECRESIFIYSVLIDYIPDILTKNLIKRLEELVTSENDEIRLNAIILYGKKLIEKMTSVDVNEGDISVSGDEIDVFIDFLMDNIPEIKGNVIFLIEQFPEKYYDYILPKVDHLKKLIEKTQNIEILDAIFNVLEKIWERSLSIKLVVFKFLFESYKSASKERKQSKILTFMAKGFNELETFISSNEKIRYNDVINFLNDRSPMIKIYDIQKISQDSDMFFKKVLKKFKKLKGDKEIFRFIFSGKKKYFVEVEILAFINHLKDRKRKVENLIKLFGSANLDGISLLNVLIKKMVKSKLIQGYLSTSYFYSYDYIKELIMDDIRQHGKVDLKKHSSDINYNFIVKIVNDINKETKFTGIFNKDHYIFLNLSSIIKEIEKVCFKENIFDLTEYSQLYNHKDFKLIEEECKKKFLTKHHHNMIWLTNLGNTRITSSCYEGQTIGFIEMSRITVEQGIPNEIAREILDEWLKDKPGLWDKSNKKYYFTKYIKKRLNQVEKTADSEVKAGIAADLAEELNLDKDNILDKLNQEIEQIIGQIKEKPSIEINSYCRMLGFKRDKFIEFVSDLNIPYLLQENEMIFDPKRISKKKLQVNKEILKKSRTDELFLPQLSKQLKFNRQMIREIIATFINEKKINGFFISDDLFITENSIINRMLDNKDIITMETIFPERDLTKDEHKYSILILERLIDSGELIGEYDREKGEFYSERAMFVKEYDDEKTNVKEIFSTYTGYMKDTFNKIRNIYMNKSDIKPGDLKRKDFLLKRIMDELEKWDKVINRALKKTEKTFSSLEDADDMTFGEVLDAEEDSEKIDGEFLLGEFNKWKEIIMNLDQGIDKAGALKKKMSKGQENEEIKENLEEIYKNLHFYDDDLW
ncbi:MAG: hypothetical protein ACTSWY_13610 [Promethearchaeota archaeon]